MLNKSLHIKWVARFFILLYLLLSSSPGSTVFWCKDAEASTHLESNLGGSCWTPCLSESAAYLPFEGPSQEKSTLSSGRENCVDSPAHSSLIAHTNQKSPKTKFPGTDTSAPHFPSLLAKYGCSECLENPSDAQNLPTRQILTALSTVVLLH